MISNQRLPLSTSPPLKTYNRHLTSGLRASGGSLNSSVTPDEASNASAEATKKIISSKQKKVEEGSHDREIRPLEVAPPFTCR